MYRYLLTLLLCRAVAAAPQLKADSDITYVQSQPSITPPAAPNHYRESRIENLPLTIPGNAINLTNAINITNNTAILPKSDEIFPESSDLSEISVLPDSPNQRSLPDIINEPNEPLDQLPNAPTDYSENTPVTKDELKPDSTEIRPETLATKLEDTHGTEASTKTQTSTERTVTEELLEAHGSDVSDTSPSESLQSERRGRNFESIETTDIFDEVTERFITEIPEVIVPRTKPTPKYIPKLSYFQKPREFVSFPTNSLEKSAKRRFRSNCRCEKIWNCPKLQISVPRCPNEYFLCCF